MSIRTSQLLAFLMIFFVSLQSFAAAQMSVCNSMIQSKSPLMSLSTMPCHDHMDGMSMDMENTKGEKNSTNKNFCTTLCSSLGAIIVLPRHIHPTAFQVVSLIYVDYQHYTSITLPRPQRPPILFS